MSEKRNAIIRGEFTDDGKIEIQLSGQICELADIFSELAKAFAEQILHISEGEFYSGLVECYQELKEQEEQQKC